MATASGVRAGHAYVLIEALDKTGKVFSQIGRRLKNLGHSVANLGMQMARVGAVTAIPFIYALREATKWDYAMRAVRAAINATNEDAAKLEKTIRRLGRSTSYTAVEVAGAAENLGRSGMSTQEILESLPTVLELGRAGKVDLNDSSNFIARGLRTFGLDASEAGNYADDLFVAMQNGTATTLELAQAMTYSAGTMKMVGGDYKTLMALLAVFANKGLFGTKGGTTANMLMSNMVANADKVRELLKFDVLDSEGNVRPMMEIFQLLAKALRGMPKGEALKALKEIVNIRGSRGGSAIMDDMERMFDIIDKMENTSGNVAKASREMDRGMWGSLKRITSAANELAITLGMNFENTFKSIEESIVPILNKFSAFAKENKELALMASKVLIGFIALSGVFVVAGSALAILGGIVSFAGSGLAVISTLFTTILGPAIAGIAIVIAAISAEFILLYSATKLLIEKNRDIIEQFKAVSEAIGNDLLITVKSLWYALGDLWTQLVNVTATLMDMGFGIVVDALQAIGILLAFEVIGAFQLLSDTMEIISGVLEIINIAVETFIQSLGDTTPAIQDSGLIGLSAILDEITGGYISAAIKARKLNAEIRASQIRLGIGAPGHEEPMNGGKGGKPEDAEALIPGSPADIAAKKKRKKLRDEIIDMKKRRFLKDQEERINANKVELDRKSQMRAKEKELRDIAILDQKIKHETDPIRKEEMKKELREKLQTSKDAAANEVLESRKAAIGERRRADQREKDIEAIKAKEEELGGMVDAKNKPLHPRKTVSEIVSGDAKLREKQTLLAKALAKLEDLRDSTAKLPESLQKGTMAAFKAENTNKQNMLIAAHTKKTAEEIAKLRRDISLALGAI